MTDAVAARIGRISLTVPDLDAATAFYRDALGFRTVLRTPRGDAALAETLGLPGVRIAAVLLELGPQLLELMAFDPPGAPYPADSTATDLWFQHCAIVVGDMAAAHAHLQGFPIAPITTGGPQTLPPNTGSVAAFKFRDPFGHPLELLEFPPDVGDPSWRGGAALFKGIDHTAIAVSDVARSRAFYQDQFGFEAAGSSRNQGSAQERLDAVAADDVDVLALQPRSAPPHLELLGYRTGSRRPIPATMRASDGAATRTVLHGDTLPASDMSARSGSKTRLLRDLDGHLLLCVEDESIFIDLSAL